MTLFPFLRRRLAAGLVAAAAAAALAPAAAYAQAAPTVDARVRAAVVDSLGKVLERAYVDADTARLIAAALRERLRAGAYDALTTPGNFAEAVTRDLRSVNNDLHLSLRHDPRSLSQLSAPRRGPGGGGGGVPSPWEAEAARQNFGLGKLEILPGNVGYLEITGFMGAPGYEEVVASALRFLERTDAVIIDVRRNGGGSGQMSHLVFSHFLGAQPVPTIKVVNRGTGETRDQTSLAEVPGPRRTDVPLYVLTSQATGSAAEEFSFVLKNQGRASLVGDRTAGAGHMVNGFDLGYGFVGGVSITRVTDPRTGLEWERVGVQPDVRVPPERALETAHAAALRAILAKTTDEGRRRSLELTAETLEARGRGARPDPAVAARVAGTYEGGRSVEYREGRLWYSRRGGITGEELVPLGGTRFALGATRILFEGDGPAPTLVIEQPDGSRTTVARTSGS